jgi:hypothetical protein
MEHYSHKLRLHLYDSSILNYGGSCSGGHWERTFNPKRHPAPALSLNIRTRIQFWSIMVGATLRAVWTFRRCSGRNDLVLCLEPCCGVCTHRIFNGSLEIVFRDRWKCLSRGKCSFPKEQWKTESNDGVFRLAAASTETSGPHRSEDNLLQLQLCCLSSGLRSGLYSEDISLST